MTAINLNVTSGRPDHAKHAAWDWPEITEDAVTIWRGTTDEPQKDIVFLLRGGFPDEIADYLEALASAIRRRAEASAESPNRKAAPWQTVK